MKKIISFVVLISTLFFFNCQENKKKENTNKFAMESLDFSNLEFNIDFGLGKEVLIENDNVSELIKKCFVEISESTEMDESLLVLFTTKEGEIFYSVNTKETLANKVKQEIQLDLKKENYTEVAEVKNCKNLDCVKNNFSEGKRKNKMYFLISADKILKKQDYIKVYSSATLNSIFKSL